jgi:hypothetical protein
MAHFRKIGWDQVGFDSNRSVQVVPTRGKATLYLIAGEDLDLSIEDTGVASLSAGGTDDAAAHKDGGITAWEKAQYIRKVVITGGPNEANTVLHARLGTSDWTVPVQIQVVNDKDSRRVRDKGNVTPTARAEIQGLSLRDAVIRVAEDQMNSKICKTTDGFGSYYAAEEGGFPVNWCGAFAYWCWQQACAIKGETCPFTSAQNLLSPQKAIHYAMNPATVGQLLRYEGLDPMSGNFKDKQEYREIGWNGNDLQRGDIVLLREWIETPTPEQKKVMMGEKWIWRHVCMVDSYGGGGLTTMDGNQGKNNCIKRVERDATKRFKDGKTYQLAFVHLQI